MKLHAPLRIGSTLVRNRLYRAPVLEGAGSGEKATQIYTEAFEANAQAGVGLIIQGNSCISEDGRSSPGMTLVNTRERMLALAPMTEAVHRWGGRVFIQIGNAGIYAMEGWHSEYAKIRTRPLVAVSKPRIHVRPALLRTPLHVMTTSEVHDFAQAFGQSAGWVREARVKTRTFSEATGGISARGLLVFEGLRETSQPFLFYSAAEGGTYGTGDCQDFRHHAARR